MTIGELYMDADGILYFLVSKRLMYKAFRGSEDLYDEISSLRALWRYGLFNYLRLEAADD